jgi:hypothetical protein
MHGSGRQPMNCLKRIKNNLGFYGIIRITGKNCFSYFLLVHLASRKAYLDV